MKLVKNKMYRRTSPGNDNKICFQIPENKNALITHVHLQEKGMKIARTLRKRLAM